MFSGSSGSGERGLSGIHMGCGSLFSSRDPSAESMTSLLKAGLSPNHQPVVPPHLNLQQRPHSVTSKLLCHHLL